MHYNEANVASPVTNEMSIKILMILALMVSWEAKILHVKGAFLHEQPEEEYEACYMEVPQGFEKHYKNHVVLMLLRSLYGLKNDAKYSWKELSKGFNKMNVRRIKVDACTYLNWKILGLMVLFSWIDDCVCFGNEEDAEDSNKNTKRHFDCDDLGNMDAYVG